MSATNDDDTRRPSTRLWLAALSACMGPMCMGTTLGWTSPALPDMELDSALYMDAELESWISSSMTLGALAGGLLGGSTYQLFGGKKSMIGLGPVFTIGWVLMCFAYSDWLIILGRVICGFASGMICGVAPAYCAQIATPAIRGLLGSGFQIFVVVGVLLIDVFGLFCDWRWLCIVGLIPGALMTCTIIFMPEAPGYLVNKHGHCEQALDALKKLRHRNSNVELELKEMVLSADNQRQLANSTGNSLRQQWRRPDFYKPLLISIFVMVFQRGSGFNAIYFYSTNIFRDSGSSLDPTISTVIMSAAIVFATTAGGLIVDKLGRKLLLIVSGAGEAVGMAALGYYYYYYLNTYDPSTVNALGWLPIVSIIVFVVMFSIGYGPVAWLLINEITPNYALSAVSSCATGAHWLCIFFVSKFFNQMEEALHPYGAYWFFTGICVGSVVFAVVFVPETKGKTVEQMQRIFSNESQRKVTAVMDEIVSTRL